MFSLDKRSIKYKLLSFDELVINLDRLSRFKLPEDSYNRVFTSILTKCLIFPKLSKQEIENLPVKILSNIVKLIWNNSVKSSCSYKKNEELAYSVLKFVINNTYKNIDEKTKTLINTKLYVADILQNLNYNNSPINLRFLIKTNELITKKDDINLQNIKRIRETYSLKFPIEKLLIVEGITEENLLPVFAEKLNYDFEKNGVYILGAGGKSKSPSLYLEMKDKIKIPMIFLFDSDAFEICNSLKKIISKPDKIIIIEEGEFEDILSENLIKRSLNKEYLPATPIMKEDLHIYSKMCKNIENFYKTRHLGEFKKAKLSKIIAKNIKYQSDISTELKKLIQEIYTVK